MFEPIKNKKIHQQVSEKIQKMILDGELKLAKEKWQKCLMLAVLQ
jgi:DNA-binding FadR family transcriptional regulator